MREPIRDPHRIEHMLQAIRNLNSIMHGKTIHDLKTSITLFFASVKCIEIVGEAAYKLSLEFKEAHPDTPWRKIIGMRHILVHGYYQLKAEEIYNVYSDNMPQLLLQLENYLKEFDN